jgi:hypothetical protein
MQVSEDLEAEVLLVAEPVRAALLQDADLAVQPLDEAESATLFSGRQ